MRPRKVLFFAVLGLPIVGGIVFAFLRAAGVVGYSIGNGLVSRFADWARAK